MFPVLLRVAVPILSPFILLQNSLAVALCSLPAPTSVCVCEREQEENGSVYMCLFFSYCVKRSVKPKHIQYVNLCVCVFGGSVSSLGGICLTD